jgi:hypothetical protein
VNGQDNTFKLPTPEVPLTDPNPDWTIVKFELPLQNSATYTVRKLYIDLVKRRYVILVCAIKLNS